MLTSRTRQAGVTLIELALALAILAVLFSFAAPSFSGWIQNLQVRTAADSIQSGLQLARTEAIRRNNLVRFKLTDAGGAPNWEVGCVNSDADCPATIQSYSSAEGASNAQVGISKAAVGAFATAIAGGTSLPAGVTFNGLGRVPTGNVGADIVRADITHRTNDTARRLVIVVSTGGAIRLCDPALSLASNPQGCS